jgi:ubiquitin carboxyl-terminal hydrolase 7
MDGLDEKQNGAPAMEVDDIVSVRDRECVSLGYLSKPLIMAISKDEAFAAKHMPDLGHDVKDFKVFTWPLSNWKKLEKKLTSPEFECGGHRWCLLFAAFMTSYLKLTLLGLFPMIGESFFSHLVTLMHHLMTPSLFISTMPTQRRPLRDGTPVHSLHWSFQILMTQQFTLPAVRLIHCSVVLTDMLTDANHRFIAEECDWGFTRFGELRKLFTIQEGHSRPTIEEEAADITVYVRVLEDPTGVLWHNFVKYVISHLCMFTLSNQFFSYDSKKETGFVGLKNQGATCYMNSLLQSLYCTNFFRKASGQSFKIAHAVTPSSGCVSNTYRR